MEKESGADKNDRVGEDDTIPSLGTEWAALTLSHKRDT